MISWHDLYTVLAAVVPLYVAMILAYGSVRWWRIFSPDQCAGINRFVAVFAVPLLSFHFISTNDPYAMNLRFIAADTLQKLIVLAGLAAWARLAPSGSLDWAVTAFSVATLPNTLVMGIPLLIAMYGPFSGSLMVQVVVLQCIVWYTLLIFLFEYRAARALIADQFPDTAASIASFHVDSDVVSLDAGRDLLQADAEIGGDGKLHVTLRKSTSSHHSVGNGMTPRPSNLTGAEIYSLSSSRNPTPRGSNFNHSDFFAMVGGAAASLRPSNLGPADVHSLQSSRGPTPRASNFDEHAAGGGSPRSGNYPAPNPEISVGSSAIPRKPPPAAAAVQHHKRNHRAAANHDAKELHMFVWSSSATPVPEAGGLHKFDGPDFAASEPPPNANGTKEIRMLVPAEPPPNATSTKGAAIAEREDYRAGLLKKAEKELEREQDGGGPEGLPEVQPKGGGERPQQMPPTSVMTRLILMMVWRKLIRNPNTYSSLIGLIWSLVAFGWHVSMPKIIAKSISILSDAGLGMAMFSLGLFMALQPKIIACGNLVAVFAMAVRFLAGPVVMAAASAIVGLRGVLLRVAIVQAALPQGIVPFVFAREYNVHPTILSTAVIFGMLVALPITLVYYILLGL